MGLETEVILLNWNGRDYLGDCLSHLLAQDYPQFRITLVDNGSTDASVAFVRGRFPDVTILENDANLGFAAGNNRALRATTADLAVLLNPDVMVAPDWLRRIVARFEEEPAVAVAGCKLWYPDGRTIQHAGGYLTPPQAMPGHFGLGEIDTGQWDSPRDCEYVIGAALAVRSSAMSKIGLLDEGYFLYYEDVDLCARVRRAGGRVVYEPAASAIHVESATAVKGSFNYLRRFHTGRWRYLLKQESGETLSGATLAAEQEWLTRVDLDERLALALAYQATNAGLEEIWTARAMTGAGPLDQEIASTIAAGLAALESTAWTLPGVDMQMATDAPALMRLFRNQHAELLSAREEAVARHLDRIGRLLREQVEARAAAEAQVAALQAEIHRLRREAAVPPAPPNEPDNDRG